MNSLRWNQGRLEVRCDLVGDQYWICLEDGHYNFQANYCPLRGRESPGGAKVLEDETAPKPDHGRHHKTWKQGDLEVTCVELENGQFWVGVEDGHYNFQVNHCPLTGRRARCLR